MSNDKSATLGSMSQTSDHSLDVAGPMTGGGNPRSLIGDICKRLKETQQFRIYYLRSLQKMNQSTESIIANVGFGYSATLPEKQRKAIKAAAKRIRRATERGDVLKTETDRTLAAKFSGVIFSNHQARAIFDQGRDDEERRMVELVSQLPSMQRTQRLVSDVRGFTALGLALILSETGDLGNYATEARLWKRCGLAVIGNVKQGKLPAGCTKETFDEHGYKAERRSQIWQVLEFAMIKFGQYRAEKIDEETGEMTPARALGQYGERFLRKRAQYLNDPAWIAKHHPLPDDEKKRARVTPEAHQKQVAAHATIAARRYAAKIFLRHLWKAWNRDLKTYVSSETGGWMSLSPRGDEGTNSAALDQMANALQEAATPMSGAADRVGVTDQSVDVPQGADLTMSGTSSNDDYALQRRRA